MGTGPCATRLSDPPAGLGLVCSMGGRLTVNQLGVLPDGVRLSGEALEAI